MMDAFSFMAVNRQLISINRKEDVMRHSSATFLFIVVVLVSSVVSGASFTDNGNGTVTDSLTSYMWQQDEGGSGSGTIP
jgi:hypothetical protein